MPTPRLFIIRHGETTWSLSGKHTGLTDIPLTPAGESRILATGRALVGADRLIAPGNLAHIFVSPRTRARRTLELLGVMTREDCKGEAEQTEEVREWEYGEYEGITSKEVRERLREKGEEGEWDIWRDGCPGGESPDQITARLDRLIAHIRTTYHEPALNSTTSPPPPSDVLIVAHGHILRALAARWIGRPLRDNPALILEAGGVGTLSYEHGRLEEPAILLGGGFVSDVVDKAEEEGRERGREGG